MYIWVDIYIYMIHKMYASLNESGRQVSRSRTPCERVGKCFTISFSYLNKALQPTPVPNLKSTPRRIIV